LAFDTKEQSVSERNISIIIPTINEHRRIGQLIDHLMQSDDGSIKEIIISDGGSTDGTKDIVRRKGATLLEITRKSRAIQMNDAAQHAKGDILYFLHADAIPPASFPTDIREALDEGHLAGSYRFKFDTKRKMLGINSFFTRFGALVCRGGDQSMYITKELFNEMGRFDESYVIMEDFDFIRRFNKKHKFHVIQKDILISDRKYENNSYMRVQIANLFAFTMFRRGVSQQRIKALYERMLDMNYD